jgi:glucose-6-phosphate dehydrogenase assembly protein OpcA
VRSHTEIEHFVRGAPIAVEVGEIERALGALWQQASAAGAAAAVSRAALWNVVVIARRSGLAATKQLVDEMAPALPTRTLTLCLDEQQRQELEATIESNVVSQPGGARMVYSEEIMIAGPPGAAGHFGALVRALQVAGVPTATFWIDPGAPEALLARELLPVTSRLVFDTTACLHPQQLFDIERLATAAQPVPVTDLGWLRLGALRALFAGLFDPPVGGAPLARAARVTVHHRPGADANALLVLAWLGVLLGWRPLRCAQTSDGGLRFDFLSGNPQRVPGPSRDGARRAELAGSPRDQSGRAGQPVAGHLAPTDGACGRSGMFGIELLTSGGERYAIRRTALDQATLQTPGVPPKPVKLDSSSDAELAIAALGSRGRDPLFARCLSYARQLWSLEPDSAGSRR